MSVIDPVALKLVDSLAELVRRIRLRVRPNGITIELRQETTSSDKRVAKLDDARVSLVAGLEAVDELRREADSNRKEAERALEDLIGLEQEKQDAQAQVTKVKRIIATDIDQFRMIAGIPNEKQRRRDKLAGFWAGVLSSLIAALIVGILTVGFRAIKGESGLAPDEGAGAIEQDE